MILFVHLLACHQSCECDIRNIVFFPETHAIVTLFSLFYLKDKTLHCYRLAPVLLTFDLWLIRNLSFDSKRLVKAVCNIYGV